MEINDEIYEVLKEFKIPKSEGVLALLAIYYKLDPEKIISEETIKAINLTKILDKDYSSGGLIKWNMPLFKGQQTEWEWVKEYNRMWDKNKERKAATSDVTKRMIEWFKKYPEYRKEDVKKATEAYHRATPDPQYLKNSAAFIFDGAGASKKSILLQWCEKTKDASSTSTMKGIIAT